MGGEAGAAGGGEDGAGCGEAGTGGGDAGATRLIMLTMFSTYCFGIIFLR